MSGPKLTEIFENLFTTDDQNEIRLAFDYFKKMYEYVLCGSKGFRGKTVVSTYRHLSGFDCNEDKLNQAQILGLIFIWIKLANSSLISEHGL